MIVETESTNCQTLPVSEIEPEPRESGPTPEFSPDRLRKSGHIAHTAILSGRPYPSHLPDGRPNAPSPTGPHNGGIPAHGQPDLEAWPRTVVSGRNKSCFSRGLRGRARRPVVSGSVAGNLPVVVRPSKPADAAGPDLPETRRSECVSVVRIVGRTPENAGIHTYVRFLPAEPVLPVLGTSLLPVNTLSGLMGTVYSIPTSVPLNSTLLTNEPRNVLDSKNDVLFKRHRNSLTYS